MTTATAARRAPAVMFAVLVVATFAAFFVAQRLKNSPAVIQQVQGDFLFSPNADGRFDRARITFKIKHADDVTVQILDAAGNPVRTLLDGRHLRAYWQIKPALRWDGRDDRGRMLRDGRYRIKLTLIHQGRSVIAGRSLVKDTTPPRIVVTSVGPHVGPGPELLPEPHGADAQIHFAPVPSGKRAHGKIHIFRTAPGPAREILTRDLPGGQREFDWNGTDDAGRPVEPGVYLAVVEWRDTAGNIGTSVPLDRASGLPILRNGRFPGRGGIMVRPVGAQPPLTPAKAGDRVVLNVDARQQRWTWSLRRLGQPPRKRSNNAKTSAKVAFAAPGGVSGVYIFAAAVGAQRTQVVVPVQARRPVSGTAARPSGVLVLLPVITWQGRNPVDDDGDGAPNTLDLGTPVRTFRVMGGDGLPQGFAQREAPLLQWLDRTRRRYDVQTDLGLLLGRGPALTGHHGVLIAGDARWLPTRVQQELRAFARRGGAVVSVGIDSLRRTVRLDAQGRLTDPSRPQPADLFGAKLGPVVTKTTNLVNFQDDPQVQLFHGAGGLFTDVPAWEPTLKTGTEANLVARAVTGDPQSPRDVIVAVRFGKGLVVRPGFPAFTTRLSTNDPAVTALMARMWTLLSR